MARLWPGVTWVLACAACNTSAASGGPPTAPPAEDAAGPAEGGANGPDASTGAASDGGDADVAMVDIDPCPDAGAVPHWSDLYRCYFGPTGTANCGSNAGGCHDNSDDDGPQFSGFVCGPSSLTCWQGMNTSILGNMLPIVIDAEGGMSAPTTTTLWSALRKTTGEGLSNMPLAPATVVFTPRDMDRIAAWIQSGAPNN